MQALLVLASFALWMHIDPDDSPFHNLSDEEAEERRFLFWFAYYTYKWTQIAVFKPAIPIFLQSNRIKPAKQRTIITTLNTHPNSQVATVCHLSSILDIIWEVINHRPVPTDAYDILSSPTTATLSLHLTHLKSRQIPPNLFLSRNDNSLTEFLASIEDQTSKTIPILDSVMVTMLYSAAVCILNRPLLYLTGFLPLKNIKPTDLTLLLNTLDKCVSAARSITGLNSWLVRFLDNKQNQDSSAAPLTTANSPTSAASQTFSSKFRRKFWKEDWYSSGVLFEAAVVLWFVTCRTQRFHWRNYFANEDENISQFTAGQVLCMTLKDRKLIRDEVLDILSTLRDLEGVLAGKDTGGGELNHIADMVSCVVEMVDEMSRVEREVADGVVEDVVVDFAVRELREFSVADEGHSHPEQQETVRAFAWVFQGLLGVEVGVRGFRWRGETEVLWKSFWDKTCVLL
ncbi:UNVERIFIED_CONTAM: hypothetical protein HDU68_008292 [Siphonaria sp. JEL0065]|nr:hypothetical protein HDU68_008292 [Siphonaria sp. JEL0065]